MVPEKFNVFINVAKKKKKNRFSQTFIRIKVYGGHVIQKAVAKQRNTDLNSFPVFQWIMVGTY